jgi:hypothetical protein
MCKKTVHLGLNVFKSFIWAFLCLLLASCGAPIPILAPNEHYQRVGPQVAEQDVRVCEQIAETGQISVDARSSREAKDVRKDGLNLTAMNRCLTERGYQVQGWP